MVVRAERNEVVEIGRPTVLPGADVVGLAVVQWAVTTGPGAGPVNGPDGGPLGRRGRAVAAPDVNRHPRIVEDDPLEHRIAAQPGERAV